MTTRRGFLRQLTQIAVTLAAAPAVTRLTRFAVSTPDTVEIFEIYEKIGGLNELLMVTYKDLLWNELFRTDYLLAKVGKDESFRGMTYTIPFTIPDE